MKISTNININAPKQKVWEVITNIENAADNISGIVSIDVLNKPESGLVGFKWEEKRIMFGKEATETMWITDATEHEFYQTRAESHGSVYISRLEIKESGSHTTLTMSLEGHPQTRTAKIMGAIMAPLFKKASIKALSKDLNDIKRQCEN